MAYFEREFERDFFWKKRKIAIRLENLIFLISCIYNKLPECEEVGKLFGCAFKSGVPSE